MALGRYVITQNYTLPAPTAATVVAGEPGTGGAAGYGGAPTTGGQLWGQTLIEGTPIYLDTASALYGVLNGAGVLRAWVQGSDDVNHAALSN